MKHLSTLLKRAENSALYRAALNVILARIIPFNRPHKFKIIELASTGTRIKIPYVKKNRNHIRGMHACALATAVELTAGVSLLRFVDPGQYRIILSNLSVDYFFQGKTYAIAESKISADWAAEKILNPLKSNEKVLVETETVIHDSNNNHLCTGKAVWQIKPWKSVSTAL